MKRWYVIVLTFVTALLISDFAFAEDSADVCEVIPDSGAAFYFSMTVLAAGIGIAFATWVTGYAQGKAISSALEGIARQPEAAGDIRINMIISAALIEGVALFAVVVCGFIL